MAKLRKGKFKHHIRKAFVSQFGIFFKDGKAAAISGLVILLISLVSGWIPDGFSEILSAIFFEGNLLKGVVQLVFGLSILFTLIYCAHRFSKEGEFEVYTDTPEKKKVLVPFLSSIGKKTNGDLMKEIEQLEVDSFEHLNSSPLRSWRMPLEAIKYHLPKLEKIVVITSPESSEQLDAFKKLVQKFFVGHPLSIEEKKVPSFENVKELFRALNEVYRSLKDEDKYRDKDVIIDITGGQKINSIAGAFMTLLYSNREFQYVSTNSFEVKSYDVMLVSKD